ncbi:hypothetical protein DN730_05250 [Marinomonas piezotolerans]|uniref:Uncharacterized protein n=1 Tax=Marinomonas piezotolerans TaxID=2213058 RepID=A0A370UBF1_9GAMM|nr:hypothetical protein [Marinomonas piezotolerans]RDL45025.1 hypothetical protein DN730_05250 [Marinomonas piezotolerans]
MVLFFPSQQALDCVSDRGHILGKIEFDGAQDSYRFVPDQEACELTEAEKVSIARRVASLMASQSTIPMQDDD